MNWAFDRAGIATASDEPLVSVFTAAYRIVAGIQPAYDSVLRQSYDRWEWVIVDDSPDLETSDYVTRLATATSAGGRIRLYRQLPPTGSIGATKAAAAALCRGEILVELDHDDELAPEALELIAATFADHPEVDFVYSDTIDWMHENERLAGPVLYPPGWGFGLGAYASEVIGGRRVPVVLAPPVTWQTIRHIVAAPNHVRAWRSSFYRRIGGHDHRIPIADDYELIVRSFLAGKMARIPRPLYVQHHDAVRPTASRRYNPEIQRRVSSIAARYDGALTQRCLDLGLVAEPASLTSARTISAANDVIDVIAEEDAKRGSPLVSVVMPTYDRPDLLRRAVASVVAQTYANFELLIVGDACPSVDETVATIDDARIRHWNLADHHGDSGAAPRNYALKAMARGTLVAYLDDDNVWKPHHLESLVRAVSADPAFAFAFSSFVMNGEEIICRRPRRFQIDTSAILHERSLLDRFGFWRAPQELGHLAHDWELVSRWEGERWAATLRPTLVYSVAVERQGAEIFDVVRQVAEEEARLGSAAGLPAQPTGRRARDR